MGWIVQSIPGAGEWVPVLAAPAPAPAPPTPAPAPAPTPPRPIQPEITAEQRAALDALKGFGGGRGSGGNLQLRRQRLLSLCGQWFSGSDPHAATYCISISATSGATSVALPALLMEIRRTQTLRSTRHCPPVLTYTASATQWQNKIRCTAAPAATQMVGESRHAHHV